MTDEHFHYQLITIFRNVVYQKTTAYFDTYLFQNLFSPFPPQITKNIPARFRNIPENNYKFPPFRQKPPLNSFTNEREPKKGTPINHPAPKFFFKKRAPNALSSGTILLSPVSCCRLVCSFSVGFRNRSLRCCFDYARLLVLGPFLSVPVGSVTQLLESF